MLNEIAFWLFFLPVGVLDALVGLVGTVSAQEVTEVGVSALNAMQIAITIPIIAAVLFFTFWGQACTLIVAKRLVASPAGRTRTSFSAVRAQAKKYIGALFLTELLRSCITILYSFTGVVFVFVGLLNFTGTELPTWIEYILGIMLPSEIRLFYIYTLAFWTLFLCLPGIIYSVRTLFYDIMMIEHGKIRYGRDALKPSYNLVKGRTWDVLWRILVIGITIFLPLGLINSIIYTGLTMLDARLETLTLVLTDCTTAFATMFFIVCSVALYADLNKELRTSDL